MMMMMMMMYATADRGWQLIVGDGLVEQTQPMIAHEMHKMHNI